MLRYFQILCLDLLLIMLYCAYIIIVYIIILYYLFIQDEFGLYVCKVRREDEIVASHSPLPPHLFLLLILCGHL